MLELKKTVIHKHLNPGQNCGAGRSQSNFLEDGKTVYTYGEEKYSRIKDRVVLLTCGGESTKQKKTEYLYAYVFS